MLRVYTEDTDGLTQPQLYVFKEVKRDDKPLLSPI